MSTKECDVLIIGAGMGGSCLARQLKRAMPDLKIINIDQKVKFDFWIGESTVEAWTDYAYRLCGLGAYLHKHHMLKNGLRFFFDTEKKDLPLEKMSETGRTCYPGAPREILAHQLDRATFDRDMCVMNAEIGIDVMLGTKVKKNEDGMPVITVSKTGHIVETDKGTIHCRWLIDAGGRTAPLAKKLDLTHSDPRHPVASYWGRIECNQTIDDLGSDAWRKKVGHTLRHLSTNHFMYKGYWIWVIPLSEKIVSIGICNNREMTPLKIKSAKDLMAFFHTHQCFRDLFPEGSYKTLDFMSFPDCPRKTKQFFSEDRWALTGMSGFVIDALFSTTGITTSFTNRLIGELIKTERSGDKELFQKQLHHFNIYMHVLYENIFTIVSRYKEFGSFAAWEAWRAPNLFNYFNTMVPHSTEDFKTYFETVKSHKKDCGCTLEKAMAEFRRSFTVGISRLNSELAAYLEATGNYYEFNSGGFLDTSPRESIVDKFYEPRDMHLEHLESIMSYEAMFRTSLGHMLRYEKVPWNESSFQKFFVRDWNSGQTLAMALAAMKQAKGVFESDFEKTGLCWTSRGPTDKEGRQVHPAKLYRDIELPMKKTA